MPSLDWWPQAKQRRFIEAAGLDHAFPFCSRDEPNPPAARVIGYGGAAGGGKTDALLALCILVCIQWAGAQVAFFRRTFPELSGPGGAILRSLEILSGTGQARYTDTNHRWTFANGSILQFCHCKLERDVHQYQSQQFDLLVFDEATHFTEYQVRYLMTRNRTTIPGPTALCVMGTNPGSVGHLWFRDWFVDLGTHGEPHDYTTESGKKERHLFIPARLEDNQILERRDPLYRATLEALPEDERRALLYGDWDVFAGQVFKEWRRDLHVVEPFKLPADAKRITSIDWGYAAPWCGLWIARCRLDMEGYSPEWERRIVYREAYKAGLTDPEQAEELQRLTAPGEWINGYPADPSMWTKRTVGKRAISSADVYQALGIRLSKGDNDRIGGKRRVHEALALLPDGKPGLLVFSTCRNLIRTLPALPYDEVKIEDVDDAAEDHAYDALRYGLSYKIGGDRPPQSAPPDYWAAVRGKDKGSRPLDVPMEVQILQELEG